MSNGILPDDYISSIDPKARMIMEWPIGSDPEYGRQPLHQRGKRADRKKEPILPELNGYEDS